ncbi:branched-chain amino acid ABC transporter permease [Derxia gummosa]|uniref:Branched-chain amino acid ABC transporter permease n=1 Tax=Derxia gummosa DSM 723 TaxID=1121388 RepID=A0A8B6X5D3_9BURK|nr:branched-chain amino acid ABC transporter permease [Derxia gummosa]
MNLQIALLLGQDGVTNGAIYALLSLSILLVFTVTRVLLIPLGEFVAFGALTMAAFEAGQPGNATTLLGVVALAACLADAIRHARERRRPSGRRLALWAGTLAWPVALGLALQALPLAELAAPLRVLLVLLVLVPLGPLLYRAVFAPLAQASALVLLIASIALHVALVGAGLLAFGPEGARTQPFSDSFIELGALRLNSQTVWVVAVSFALIGLLFFAFQRTLYGKALRAVAFNRTGARLVGISPDFAGSVSFGLATFIGVMSGVLIAPITTLYYDSGFIISLKGFVGSIIGGLASYPIAAGGALLVGLIEAFSAFFASQYKEVIVFTLIIPVLLWRSLTTHRLEDEE